MSRNGSGLLPYRVSLAGTLLAAREAVMAPIRPALRRANVTDQQWRVLRVLAEEAPMSANRIADRALLHSPSVTRILKELNDRGLIERASDPDDLRRLVVAITAEGRALIARTARHTRSVLDSYGAAFGAERLSALQSELSEFVTAIEAIGQASENEEQVASC